MVEKYEVISLIGKGNFGSISKIRRKEDGKILVWKELNYGIMEEKDKHHIVSEINILKELHHPNIVKYYDRIIDKQNTKIYIIMEYCPGGDLGQLIKRRKQTKQYISEEIILKIFSQVASALYECHNHKGGKILHRDIKPSNVFLDNENNVKLGDFGLSRMLSKEMNFAYSNVGTPYYMSPEQIDEKEYNEKSDIWSLGCFLYELTALHPPFEAHNHLTLALKIKSGKVEKIPDIYSGNLKKIISSLMNLNPDKRPNINQIVNLQEVNDILKEKNIRDNFQKLKKYESELKMRENNIIEIEKKLKIKEKFLDEREKILTQRENFIKIKEEELLKTNNKINKLYFNDSNLLITSGGFNIQNNNSNKYNDRRTNYTNNQTNENLNIRLSSVNSVNSLRGKNLTEIRNSVRRSYSNEKLLNENMSLRQECLVHTHLNSNIKKNNFSCNNINFNHNRNNKKSHSRENHSHNLNKAISFNSELNHSKDEKKINNELKSDSTNCFSSIPANSGSSYLENNLNYNFNNKEEESEKLRNKNYYYQNNIGGSVVTNAFRNESYDKKNKLISSNRNDNKYNNNRESIDSMSMKFYNINNNYNSENNYSNIETPIYTKYKPNIDVFNKYNTSTKRQVAIQINNSNNINYNSNINMNRRDSSTKNKNYNNSNVIIKDKRGTNTCRINDRKKYSAIPKNNSFNAPPKKNKINNKHNSNINFKQNYINNKIDTSLEGKFGDKIGLNTIIF